MPEINENGFEKTRPHIAWWAWLHVLSLEAPLVAVLWQASLARAYRVTLTPGTTVGLALAVWSIYALDRWLDGRSGEPDQLDVRHAFYLRYSRWIAGVFLPVLAVALAWVGFFVVPEGILWQCAALGLLIGVYLTTYAFKDRSQWSGFLGALVGFGSVLIVLELPIEAGVKIQLVLVGLIVMTFGFFRRRRSAQTDGFPKEVLGSLLFALGCTMGVQFFTMGEGFAILSADALLLWVVFAMNLIGISCVEHAAGGGDSDTVPVLWPLVARGYAWILASVMALSIGWTLFCSSGFSAKFSPSAQVSAALALMNLLWWYRKHCSPLLFRVLADGALVIPPLLAMMLVRLSL